jgi:hypothetical protein
MWATTNDVALGTKTPKVRSVQCNGMLKYDIVCGVFYDCQYLAYIISNGMTAHEVERI